MRRRAGEGRGVLPRGLKLLYEDRDLLVVDKPAGLLTMGTDSEKDRTAYFVLTDYVRKGQAKSRNRVFIVHRLDKETSGVLLFAKNEQAKFRLQEHWNETRKIYLAIVHGQMEEPASTFSSYLVENSVHVVHSTNDREKGRWSETEYRVLQQMPRFALLEVALLTGRKHQIRVHLSESGHPVVGDKKYGGAIKEFPHLALHAYSITFPHPFSGKSMTFQAKPPSYFGALVSPIDPHDENCGE